jgi:hypothetical protein
VVYYLLRGVYDRSVVHAKKIAVPQEAWASHVSQLLARLTSQAPANKLSHWCSLFAEADPDHTKLDALAVVSSTALVYDIDESNGAGFDEIMDIFRGAGYGFYAWETWRSRANATRVRVVFPLATPALLPDVLPAWSATVRGLSGVVVHKGKYKPTEGIVVDPTSAEVSRLHVMPANGARVYVHDAPLSTVSNTSRPTVSGGALWAAPPDVSGDGVFLSPTEEAETPSGGDTDLAGIILEWEKGDALGESTPIGEVTPEHISLYARSNEPTKARCRCPKLDPLTSMGSYSAWARFVRGVLYISCTSANHNHPAGMTWVGLSRAHAGALIYPPPYSKSPSHMLLCAEADTTKRKKKDHDTESMPAIKHRVVSFTSLTVSKVYQDGDTNDEWWHLEWSHITHHGLVGVTLRRDDCGAAAKLSEKAGRLGLDVNESNKKELTRYLSEFVSYNRARIPTQMTASRLGWFDNSFLMGNTWIAGDEGMMRELVIPPSDGGVKMARAFHSTGTLAGWAQGFHKLVAYPMATIGILVAAASPLLARVGCQSFAFEWASGTGTGKTTSMRMAESVFAKPIDCEASWDNTKVSFERKAAFLCNLPLFLDDTKTSDQHGDRLAQALEWAIYRAVSGEGRGRGKPGGMDIQANWNLIMFSTGEEPIYGIGQSGGARARLVSIQAPPFVATTDGEVSRVVAPICDDLYSNYGTLGPALIQQISQMDTAILRAAWTKYREHWLTYLTGRHSTADRISSHLALIELAGRLIKKVLVDNGLDTAAYDPHALCEQLAEAMVDVDLQSGVTDPVIRSFAAFYGWCLSHRHNFWSIESSGRNSGQGPSMGWLGRWDGGDNWSEVYFSSNALTRFLKDSGFPGSPTTLVSAWTQRGLLVKPTDGSAKWSVRIAGSVDQMWRATRMTMLNAGTRPNLLGDANIIEVESEPVIEMEVLDV